MPPPPPPPARRSVDSHETNVDTEGADSASSLEDADSASVSEAADSASIPEELYRAFTEHEDPADQFIPVSFDLDVTVVSEFSGADKLREEMRAMTRIQAESEQRAIEDLQCLDKEWTARKHRLDTSFMTSHPSTHAPHSPVLSSAAAKPRSLLARPPTSIWDNAKSLTRIIFSCVHKEKNSNE
ncbi:hypothetical protein FA95DRAFT_443366 [Auriscalpium vulgare]|uniref:Uncharacterized protein n=1 Tax=Auriscalpium vulgare TaxID=40419 RepID=A0ACB8RFW4_9AGAM|nr:hypothetical protein FA95DRAFT_443366 [Auriscalpium vulgare]